MHEHTSPEAKADAAVATLEAGRPRADAVVASGVSKRFGSVLAVRDLSFTVPERCVAGLLGPNGAGKTTTIRMLAGVLAPDRGTLRVAGFDVAKDSEAARAAIGYLPESAPVHPELRTREFLRYRASLTGLFGRAASNAIDRCVTACDLGSVTGRLVGALSKGYRQRVGVAAAMLSSPRVLILDEPSVGLDPHQLLAFRQLLRDLGKERTVLVSSHILAEIEATCDRAILVAQGSIVAQGPIESLRAKAGDRYVVEGEGGDVRRALSSLAELGSLTAEALDARWMRVTASAAAGTPDLREAIAADLAKAGIRVRELRRDRASLETLFVEATRTNAAREGQRGGQRDGNPGGVAA